MLPRPQLMVPARVATCDDPKEEGEALELAWTYGPGNLPKFLNIRVFSGTDFKIEMTPRGGFDVPDPNKKNAEVPVNRPQVGMQCGILFTGNNFRLAGRSFGGQEDKFVRVIRH